MAKFDQFVQSEQPRQRKLNRRLYMDISFMAMSKGEREFHRKTAASCFNQTWDHLEKKGRDASEEQRMLHLVHASRFHWGLVGTPKNLAISDWQISRVYAALNQPQLALQFSKSCLQTCEKNNLQEILCTAYEAMARAHAVAGDYESARGYIQRAREQVNIPSIDDEDRKTYLDQILETEGLIDIPNRTGGPLST